MKDYMDYICDCGCRQKLRIAFHIPGKEALVDIGILKEREKSPKVGIVMRRKEIDKMLKYINDVLKATPPTQ